MLHILPVNDLKPHEETGLACWCNPSMMMRDECGHELVEPILVHNSADGREYQEMLD
jgi:hypothetical protein